MTAQARTGLGIDLACEWFESLHLLSLCVHGAEMGTGRELPM
ncbi:MAG: hypothetical protein ACYSUV_10590 [Planctomycetota bacterium]